MIINMAIKGDIEITIMITIIGGTIEMPPRSPNPAYLAPIQAWEGGDARPLFGQLVCYAVVIQCYDLIWKCLYSSINGKY